MKKSILFLIFNLFFVIGISVGFLVEINFFYLYLIFLGLIIFLFLFYKHYFFKICLICLCFIFFGIWRYQIGSTNNNDHNINLYNNNTIKFIGVIDDEPDKRLGHVKLTIEVKKIIDNDQNVNGKVLLTTKLFPEFKYGDELEIDCNLQDPKRFNDFAYDKYLARYDIYSVCYYPKIKLIRNDQGYKFYSFIYNFKNRLKLIIEQSLSEPQSSLLVAMTLGNKRGLSQDLTNKFGQIGISHIVAISGMHIGILAIIVFHIMIGLGFYRDKAFYFVIFILVLYITMIGFPASAIRAGIMIFMVLLAVKMGRVSQKPNALFFAGAMMLMVNPMLIYDIGFQLSFLSVLGLIYILPLFEDWSGKLSNFLKIKELFLISLSAQIATLPLVLYYFGKLSLIAPLANIVVVPFVPFIMIGGLILMFCGLIWIGFAQIIGIFIWLIIGLLITAVSFLASFKLGFFNISISWWMVIFCYFLMVIALSKRLKVSK